ncbi:MAG: RNA polymerase-associated protein RapA, partial [Planctomycetes bacterium]|nr:RNA polymerase-associated protein RapA [Planctomycetota bacterium]
LGRSGHFARLRLLDPDRFHSIEAFQQEEQSYQPVAEAATQLLEDNQLPQQLIDTLLQILEQDHATPLIEQLQDKTRDPAEREQIRDELIEMLLDRHGTGRALFRNTRDRIKGFARRQLHSYPLPLPESYSTLTATTDPTLQLYPETIYTATDGIAWWQFDPRVEWLIEKLRELRGEKILLICAHAETAQGLEQALRQREGIAAALFHE